MGEPSPLFATLQEEARKKGETLDLTDGKLRSKLAGLSLRAGPEEIIQAFRAFLADPTRTCTPFWFPDRFERYAKQEPAKPATAQPTGPTCPACHGRLVVDAEPELFSCLGCFSWWRKTGDALEPATVERIDTVSLPLPWKDEERAEAEKKAHAARVALRLAELKAQSRVLAYTGEAT